ncbi:hypothetical protein [Wolbachia endosymbiont of Drosophila tsacasi]|uniref:hypothetical protein n=1 Tax=Wolbachia endosymbiont of Drosophila tsacasi TaxID=3002579 RepID=UPI0023A94E62|nr:hypothetical protein [Wolbachia endosymbiont of Drosophila tsacasi]MDE5062629.1 hypothetical protein [Wolbachia endosymbiont of Drosophila tsacasi]
MSGEVANKKFSYGVLEYLEEDISLLDNENFTQCIIRLLQTGADPSTKGQD